jgi:predicted nuclease of predicted toxin-antitoxin system
MLFVLDENFSKNLAEGLHLLEKSNPGTKISVDVISAEVFMGRISATDEEILEALGDKGVLFSKDKDFKQLKMYAKIIEGQKAKVLFFRYSKRMVLYWDILTELVTNWEKIKKELSKEAPPYVYEFSYGGRIQECHLR